MMKSKILPRFFALLMCFSPNVYLNNVVTKPTILMRDSWKSVQMRTFTKWLNAKLGTSVTDLPTALSDGIILARLLSKLSQTTLQMHDPAITRFQKVENVQRVLDAVTQNGVRLINIGSVDIVDGSEKLVLGLLWAIILRYSIFKGTVTTDRALLAWAQAAAGPKVLVKDFSSSWADGRAFCAVLRRFNPELVPESWIDFQNEPENTLEHAFGVAEQLGVARLLDVQDLIEDRPDAKSVMTYVAALYDRFRYASPAPMASITLAANLKADQLAKIRECSQNLKELRHRAGVIAEAHSQLMKQARLLAFASYNVHRALCRAKMQAAGDIGALHSVEAAIGAPLTDCEEFLNDLHLPDINPVNFCEKCFSVLEPPAVYDLSSISKDMKIKVSAANRMKGNENVQMGNLDVISVCSSTSDLSELSSESDKDGLPRIGSTESARSVGYNPSAPLDLNVLGSFQSIKELLSEDPHLFRPIKSNEISKFDTIDDEINILCDSSEIPSQIKTINEKLSKSPNSDFEELLRRKKNVLEQLDASKETNTVIQEAVGMFEAVDADNSGRILVSEAESIFCVLGLKYTNDKNMEVEIVKNERTQSFSEYIAKQSFIRETQKRHSYACSYEGISKKIDELRKCGQEGSAVIVHQLEEMLQNLGM